MLVISFYIVAASVLAWASLDTGPALGRFRPMPLILGVFLAYNALPFAAILIWPSLLESLLLDTFDYYDTTTLTAICQQVFYCTLSAYSGQLLASVIYESNQRRCVPKKMEEPKYKTTAFLDMTLIEAIFLLLMIGVAIAIWLVHGSLFGGYDALDQENVAEVMRRGTLSSTFLLLFVTYTFYWNVGEDWRWQRMHQRFKYRITTIIVIFTGGLLMSLGGRLYIISVILVTASVKLAQSLPNPIQREGVKKKFRRWQMLLAGAAVLGGAGLVGIWRSQGSYEISVAVVNILSEPLYVSISLASLYFSNTLPMFAFPTFLIHDWVGLMPSSIYPEKIDRFFAVSEAYRIESPVGGLSGLASLIVNFGWLGTIVLFGLLGFFLTLMTGVLRNNDCNGVRRLSFVIATTLPIFSLLRDPMVISVYKNLIQNSLFWPWILSLLVGTRIVPSVMRRSRYKPHRF